MCKAKQKAISMICIIALVASLFGMMPAEKVHGATFLPVIVNGECENGYVDDGAAYYRFNLNQNGLARVDVSSSGDVDFTVYEDSGLRYTVDLDSQGYANLPLGDYFVKVEGSGNFSVAVGFSPLNEYDAEPNNTMKTAIKMTSGTTYEGHVYSSYKDVDWYKLVVKAKSIVHYYLDVASGATAFIYDKDENLVDYVNGCAPGLTSPRYDVKPGTYYICIQPAYQTDRNYTFSARIVERPTIPKIKSVTATGMGKAKITWTKSKYAEGYWLYKESTATGSWSRVATIPAGTLSYTDYQAPYLGSSCIYHVCGYRYDSKDPYNQEILSHETDKGTKYKGQVPKPKNVKVAKLNGNTIKVSWNKISGVTGYKVYRKANGGKFKLVKTIKGNGILFWKDTSVKKGMNYTYKVKAYYKTSSGKIYKSSYSTTAKAKLTGTIAKPTKVKAKEYTRYNKVTWGKVRTATGYKIYRKVGAGKYKLVKTTTSTSYKDKSVKKGKKYTYKVKAYYKNYTYSSSKGKYTYKTVNSKYSKTASVKR